jgi:cysteine desulfurase
MREVFLDFQATTPLDPRVLDAMMPWLTRPSNPHALENRAGRLAAAAVEEARAGVADLVGAANIVLRSFGSPGRRIIHSSIEHPCVREAAAELGAAGAVVDVAEVGEDGVVAVETIEGLLETPADIVSVMAVNNEIGTVQPIREIAQLCRETGARMHTDAAQAAGRIALRIGRDFDLATISSHKIYGPQGVGAIVATEAARGRLRPLAFGGGQERGFRPGTVPVALAVGMGEACRLALREREADWSRAAEASNLLLARLGDAGLEFVLHGSSSERVPHNLNLSIPGLSSEDLLARVPGLALSTGSACSAGSLGPSRVLAAIGVEHDLAEGAIRIGFGRTTTLDDVEFAARCLAGAAIDATKTTGKRSGL